MIKITDRYSAPNEYFLHNDLFSVTAQEMMEVFFKNFYKLPLFSLFLNPHSVVHKKFDLPNISNKDLTRRNKFASWKERFLESHFLAVLGKPSLKCQRAIGRRRTAALFGEHPHERLERNP